MTEFDPFAAVELRAADGNNAPICGRWDLVGACL
jgi:hypothetical protein